MVWLCESSATVAVIEISAEPSKLAVPVISPVSAIALAVANFPVNVASVPSVPFCRTTLVPFCA